MLVLSCINTKGESIPNFYIFKGKRKSRNFVKKIGERGVGYAMLCKLKLGLLTPCLESGFVIFYSKLEKTTLFLPNIDTC